MNYRPDEPQDNLQRVRDCAFPLSESDYAGLLRRFGPTVKAACCRILQDPALAEDVAQETFVQLVRKLPSLPPETILGGWLYVTACNLARTRQRTEARRRKRESQAGTENQLMNPAEPDLWSELEPLLDDALLALSQRQRDLVLLRYLQANTQRVAAGLVGCSESVASRELAAGLERLRSFFNRRGITVSTIALASLLSARGAQGSVAIASGATAMSSASFLTGASTMGSSITLTLMKTTTITKLVAAAAFILVISGTVHFLKRPVALNEQEDRTGAATPRDRVIIASASTTNGQISKGASRMHRPGPIQPRPSQAFDEAARKAAHQKQNQFLERLSQFALMDDPQRIQELLDREFSIHLSEQEVKQLKERGPKGFTFGVIELWATKQPQDALVWAASTFPDPTQRGGWDLQQSLLEAAQKSLPNLTRATLENMLPDSPGKSHMLDLEEVSTDPRGFANRILNQTDALDRTSQLSVLAQGWTDTVAAVEWGKQNLDGADKAAFYSQIGYNLAHQNPQTALDALAELKGTDSYASTLMSMMRGLVQEGGRGSEVAGLIASAEVSSTQRADLISELSRRWVRSDPEAAVNWVNSLTSREDVHSAIPLLVSQLDNERVTQTVDVFLKNRDPLIESALIEAAAPESLRFDPEKSRLILDPLISQDPSLKLKAGQSAEGSREEMLWNSVNLTAKQQAEQGSPSAALDWLGKLPFASQDDYAKAAANVLSVWNIRAPSEAENWLQSAPLTSSLRSALSKAAQH